MKSVLRRIATVLGLRQPSGIRGYVDARALLQGASAAGVDVNVHMESALGWNGFCHQAAEFFDCLKQLGVPGDPCRRVVEIGAGSGRHVSELRVALPEASCTAYEPDPVWRRHLAAAYGAAVADVKGDVLHRSDDASVDLVHAHAVFVYLPFLSTAAYIREAGRVLRTGGGLAFDAYTEDSFDAAVTDKWLQQGQRYPTILPRTFIVRHAAECGLTLLEENVTLSEEARYFFFRKE